MRKDYNVATLSALTATVGEIRTKHFWAPNVKWPSLLTDFYQTYTTFSACGDSKMWYYSVTPLQTYGRYGTKNYFGLKSKDPFITDSLQHKLLFCCACAGIAMWYLLTDSTTMLGDTEEKLFRLQE
jgi:hypothetical protein